MASKPIGREQVAEAVRTLRGERTQEEFGKELGGVAHSTICYWENGEVSVSPFNCIKLLNYAKRTSAAPEVLEVLEAIQPEMGA